MRLEDFDDVEIAELNGRAAAVARKWNAGDDEAVEIAQALLVQAFESGEEFTDHEHALAWFQRVAKHRAIDVHRHERVVEENLERDRPFTISNEIVARDKIQGLVDRLPDKYHDVIRLKYGQGLSAQEVGERTGYSANTVNKMLSEARAVLRPDITDPRAGFG